MTNHAILSPSGFKALMLCPAKPAMERGLPDKSSEHADEGTAAHFLGSECLLSGADANAHLGRRIIVDGDGVEWATADSMPTNCSVFTVDQDMVDYVQRGYIDVVRGRAALFKELGATDVELFVEQALPIGHITGEEGAEGTGDAIIIASFPNGTAVVDVIDLKYGKGVEVDAIDNPQLKLYALGTIEKFGMVYDFTQVNTLVCQPRITPVPSEDNIPVALLREWGENVAKPAAYGAMDLLHAEDPTHACNPHEDACRFCKAKAACPALSSSVEKALGAEFTDLTTQDKVEQETIVHRMASTGNIGAKLDAVPLIEMWCKAIRGEAEKLLLAGAPVAGYKLVQGKRGARAWADTQAAEKMLKSFRLKNSEMYDFTVISPTTAEKKLGKQVKRWEKLQPLITQSEGKPSVAPISDKRPALEIKPVSEEFSVIEGADDLV